jgi:hypothetical protein
MHQGEEASCLYELEQGIERFHHGEKKEWWEWITLP